MVFSMTSIDPRPAQPSQVLTALFSFDPVRRRPRARRVTPHREQAKQRMPL
jgi:hypothetical protein